MQRTRFLRIATSVLAIAASTWLTCGFGNQGDPITSIRGVVTDSVTGEPVDSAVLRIGDTLSEIRFYSDTTGTYGIFAGIGYGTYQVTCRKDGYFTKQLVVRSYKGHNNLTSVDFRLSIQ